MSDKSLPAPINAPNNSGIIAPNNSGSITQNQGPPRTPLGLYQSGQYIGIVTDFSISADGKQIIVVNPRLAGGAIDPNGNLEFQNFVVSCPELMDKVKPNAAMNVISIGGSVTCKIMGNR